MAPVVHGFENEYAKRIDFIYLNVADPRNDDARTKFGFKATPHFFLTDSRGTVLSSMQGVVPADSLRAALDRLIAPP